MGERQSRKSEAGAGLSKDTTALAAQARAVLRGCSLWERTIGSENHIRSWSLYPPSASRNGQWLIVAKAWSGGHRLVAFHRSSDPLTCMAGFFQRAEENKLEWKVDDYAQG